MLKKYKELTAEQKKQVSVMYSDPGVLEQYLYNFDENGNYHGRQYNPPEGETEGGIHFGRLHIELEDKKEEVKEVEKPKKLAKRTKKK